MTRRVPPGERVECGLCGVVEYLAAEDTVSAWRERHDALDHPSWPPHPRLPKRARQSIAEDRAMAVRCPQCGAEPWRLCTNTGGASHPARELAS